ncbi:MAG: glycerophosphodiester phosphodiesterase family protein [Thermodesulfobacteriota bacterium]|nr:glycerophosphodiester phosphodiesterase family protein [Thermodesulfobacteriota bacterium]
MPASQPFTFTHPLLVAHRGFRANYPENTMIAFKAGVDAGAQMVELDVHMTRDRELVVIHDDTLDRTTDGKGRVDEHTLSELKKLDAGHWFHPRFAGERIPTLREVLRELSRRALINIEIKSDYGQPRVSSGIEEGVLDLLTREDAFAAVLISSFDPQIIENTRRLNTSLPVAFISKSTEGKKTVDFCRGLDVFSFHPNFLSLDKELVKQMHAAGIQVFPYNVNSEPEFQRLIKTGADGLITDEPLLFKNWYSRLGATEETN